MTDPKLLPLPEGVDVIFSPDGNGAALDVFTAEQVQDYARANMEPMIDEIEALRAEVAAWRELSDHVRAGACNAIWPDRYTDARTSDVAAALKRAERLAEALRDIESRPWNGVRPIQIAARAALRDHDKGARNG